MVFLCKLKLLLRAAARKSKRRGTFDMSSLVAPPLEQETVVPSEPQARRLSRDSQSQSFTSTRNVPFRRQTSRHRIQKHVNIARGVISMKPLCLRLGVGTVTRALHAQPDCGSPPPFIETAAANVMPVLLRGVLENHKGSSLKPDISDEMMRKPVLHENRHMLTQSNHLLHFIFELRHHLLCLSATSLFFSIMSAVMSSTKTLNFNECESL